MANPPSKEQTLEALARLCASQIFSQSGQLRKLLVYLVTETLEGRSHRIKSYSIAVDVFHRSPVNDLGNDAIVRTTAGRLRQALVRYYHAHPDDPVVIRLPKGHYVPEFLLGGFSTKASGIGGSARSSRTKPSPKTVILLLFILAVVSLTTVLIYSSLIGTQNPIRSTEALLIVRPVDTSDNGQDSKELTEKLSQNIIRQLVNRGGLNVIASSVTSDMIDAMKNYSSVAAYILTSSPTKAEQNYCIDWTLTNAKSMNIVWENLMLIFGTPPNVDVAASTFASGIIGLEGAIPILLLQEPDSALAADQCFTISQRQTILYYTRLQLSIKD